MSKLREFFLHFSHILPCNLEMVILISLKLLYITFICNPLTCNIYYLQTVLAQPPNILPENILIRYFYMCWKIRALCAHLNCV